MRSLDVVSNARSGWNVPTPMVVCYACAMKHFWMGVELSSVETMSVPSHRRSSRYGVSSLRVSLMLLLSLMSGGVFFLYRSVPSWHANVLDQEDVPSRLVSQYLPVQTNRKKGKKLDESFLEMLLMQMDHNENLNPRKSDRKPSFIDSDAKHNIAGLSCEIYNPALSSKAVQEMVYWRDIPSDSVFKSPFYDDRKYLTFQPDDGGWNNIRMGMETIVSLAHAMGRTLVLPPEKKIYLIGDSKGGNQKGQFDFNAFFHMDSLSNEHDGINIITMEEFLKREGMTGKLKNIKSGLPQLPPHKRTDWNGYHLKELWEYLGDVGVQPKWSPSKCLAAFPASSDPKDIDELEGIMKKAQASGSRPFHYSSRPVNVDAEPLERLKENRAGRSELCIYNETLQEAPHIFFENGYPQEPSRLLAHFYTFLFFQDWKQGVWALRFVRDHIRYVDELMCAAATIVDALRNEAEINDKGKNHNATFDTLHIRRGDFQYKDTRIDADEIYNNIKDVLENGSTIYIATDERDKRFFDALKEHYKLYFLDDFLHLIPNINTNYYGMLDQLISSKGRNFFGTFYSTFTGYVMRLRGYHSTAQKLEGHEKGITDSYYFVPKTFKSTMRTYTAIQKPFWAREFPVSWRDIDNGI